jgi:hypothetical protein
MIQNRAAHEPAIREGSRAPLGRDGRTSALAFARPRDVIMAPHLTPEEKRIILASWASDASSVESSPGLRRCPGLPDRFVPLDAVLDALRLLDVEAAREGGGTPLSASRTSMGRVRWLTARSSRVA